MSAESILNYLNAVCNKRFRPVKNNLRFIQARLDEGFTEDDCKEVIDKKSRDRFFIENDHLNPTTLFRPSNFERYLNENKQDTKGINDALLNQL